MITTARAGGKRPDPNLSEMTVLGWQWLLIVGVSLALFLISPFSRGKEQFFRAKSKKGKAPDTFLLTTSLVISWIFAKSITNAANLGLKFGIVGGVSYAAYYLGFLTAGWLLYRMRTRGGFQSIHHFLGTRFGKGAIAVFSVLIGFRLFNEVWSNTMVIGTYFGDKGTSGYYWAILVFTLLTLAYVLKGGMRSSILTDLIQFCLFGFLLFIILGILIPRHDGRVTDFLTSGSWTQTGGINLLFVALIQSLSYPFHDPVMTDRAFISDPRKTLKSFIYAGIIGAVCILLFSFVGIYAGFKGMEGQAPVEVSQSLGALMMLGMNLIMITSAASTLDSTFSSFAKLSVEDLKILGNSTFNGRLAMIFIALLGTIPVFLGPEILSATTISGTMVIGLAPVFVFWKKGAPPISFHLSVMAGVVWGFLLALEVFPEEWPGVTGPYASLLVVNALGTICCFLLFLIPIWMKPYAGRMVRT